MKRRLHITMTYPLFNWIKATASANGLSVSSFINYKMIKLKQEEENDRLEPKDLQSLIQPQD